MTQQKIKTAPAHQIAQLIAKPWVINLGIGQPQMSLLPVSQLQQASRAYWENPIPEQLAYGYEPGPDNLRQALADFLTAAGDPTHFEQIFITGGASQALDLLCTIYTVPGETIFVEEPTYFLALRIFADHHLNVVSIPVDQDGLRIDILEEALQTHRPKLVYTIPTFHNPTGITLSAERRQRLIELSQTHDFLIAADEVYQLLNYSGEIPRPFAAEVDAGTIISINSFSKILAPGLRLGWIKTAKPHFERFFKCALLDSGGGINPFTAQPVRVLIESGGLAGYLDQIKTIYRERIDVLDDALQQSNMRDMIRYHKPSGGYFFWLEFPAGFSTTALRPIAAEHGVGFQPGSSFSHDRGLTNGLRLSFAHYEAPQIREAVTRLEAAAARLLG